MSEHKNYAVIFMGLLYAFFKYILSRNDIDNVFCCTISAGIELRHQVTGYAVLHGHAHGNFRLLFTMTVQVDALFLEVCMFNSA